MDNFTDLLSSTYACIFMDNVKEEFLETKVFFCVRYIDNFFFVCTCDQVKPR